MQTRNFRPRKDNDSRHAKVDKARRLIYEDGIDVGSDRVEKVLRLHSLIPTRVCFWYSCVPLLTFL